MPTVGTHGVRPFVSPFPGSTPAQANDVRGNDNQLRVAHNTHDADATIHLQSGTFANRPTTIADGATYYATDTGDTYSRVAGVWVLSAWAHWYGSAFDTTDQTAASANVGQAVTFNNAAVLRGVTLSNTSRLNVQYAGDYNVQFSAQLMNPDSAECDVWFWFAKNGTAIADTAGRITVPKKHGSTNGHSLVCWNVYVALAATDYVELYWQTQNVATLVETVAASGSAPQSPSAILTINRI
jgi:hypothetical protein